MLYWHAGPRWARWHVKRLERLSRLWMGGWEDGSWMDGDHSFPAIGCLGP